MADIEAEGRRQLARDGAAGLSVRSVARALDMASSAIYRYVESRDALLTLLIVAGYDRLGATLEAAGSAEASPRERWVATCEALRSWAHGHPQEYALLYGSPVPGYAAPQDTIGPATRVYAALGAPVAGTERDWPDLDDALAADGRAITSGLGMDAAPAAGIALLRAWTALFGHVTLELFGHTHGVITDQEAMFAFHVEALADELGLP